MIENRTKEVEVPCKKVCDKCGRIALENDHFEWAEFQHFNFTGGYGSVFGDGTVVDCDLCQHCMKELIGGIARTFNLHNWDLSSIAPEIIVNGEEFTVHQLEITYADIVKLAGLSDGYNYSMTWHLKKNGTAGIIAPGESVKIQDNMIFNVVDTSNA